ncbi:hypothetical protein TL16_g04883 [Triparma laevis f. inornata]|uniref:lipoyl(octanoyl) transferase n=1 Tax=Triparma laevis f. inornata TaxID=1714386 RepID=A0A9W7E7T3_9STRA|nr:hypothetical protein TL16_g04883 [Triparma laevis f. inornata]
MHCSRHCSSSMLRNTVRRVGLLPSSTILPPPSHLSQTSAQIFKVVAGRHIAYDAGYALQSSLQTDVQASCPPSLVLLEHQPVYTLGRRADVHSFKFKTNNKTSEVLQRGAKIASPSLIGVGNSTQKFHEQFLTNNNNNNNTDNNAAPILKHPTNSADLIRTTRGGDITYHGPGQLTAYPILPLSLAPFKKDLHWYLSKVEDVVIRSLRRWGLEGERDPRGTGVWVGGKKVAQVGIGCSQWITQHGFAINVTNETKVRARNE